MDNHSVKMLTQEDILQLLPDRKPESHKGDYGRILLLCGSRGYTGAGALAALGALRTGAGLVYLGVPESIYVIEAAKLLEPVVFPLDDDNGMFSALSAEAVISRLEKMDAVLIGPGIGSSKGTFLLVKTVLERFSGPVVLDADGINVLSGHRDLLRGRKGPTILTPHAGEFAKIGGEISSDRVFAAKTFAEQLGVILLLKGHRTVITDGHEVYVNTTGNPGMAVGGSGDILAGMIVSLLGQGMEPIVSAACATWLHGRAGDICARQLGQYGMIPSDMLKVIPRLMK